MTIAPSTDVVLLAEARLLTRHAQAHRGRRMYGYSKYFELINIIIVHSCIYETSRPQTFTNDYTVGSMWV